MPNNGRGHPETSIPAHTTLTFVQLQMHQRPFDKSATQGHYYCRLLTTILTPLQCKNLYLSFSERWLTVLDTFYGFFVLKSTILSNLHCKEAELVPAVSQNLEAILKCVFITPKSVPSAQKPFKYDTLGKLLIDFTLYGIINTGCKIGKISERGSQMCFKYLRRQPSKGVDPSKDQTDAESILQFPQLLIEGRSHTTKPIQRVGNDPDVEWKGTETSTLDKNESFHKMYLGKKKRKFGILQP